MALTSKELLKMHRDNRLNPWMIGDWLTRHDVDPIVAAMNDVKEKRWVWAWFWLIPAMAALSAGSLLFLLLRDMNTIVTLVFAVSVCVLGLCITNLGLWLLNAVKLADDPEPYMLGVHLDRFMTTCGVDERFIPKLSREQGRGFAKKALKELASKFEGLETDPLNIEALHCAEQERRNFRILIHSFSELGLVGANWQNHFKKTRSAETEGQQTEVEQAG